MWLVAAAAFVAIYFFRVPFPMIVLSAGLLGFVAGKISPLLIPAVAEPDGRSTIDPEDALLIQARPALGRGLRICAISLLLWWLPIALAAIFLGPQHTIFREGIFFSKAALVTFGGAYAVLPYVSQQAVENYHWLGPGQMLDGLGLAETTPGPLIMVLQFVGFLGGWNLPGGLPPVLGATLGALITTWTTFVPCFLWILVGAPYVERLRRIKSLSSALSTVTAAVVGVILNLAIWFGLHVIFPTIGHVDWFAIVTCAIAFAGMLYWKWNIVPVVLGSGLLGLIYTIAGFR
jgi:chromate transporter